MKKYLVLLLLPVVLVFQFCSSTKKTSGTSASTPATSTPTVAKMTFEHDLKPLISEKCGPCHTTGNKKKLDVYAGSKETVDDMIARIEKNPGEKGFMPFRHDKLSDSAINVFKQWKTDGLLEK